MWPSRGCSTFAWRWIVATTYEPGSCGTGKCRPRERSEDARRVRHHVAHDVDPTEDAFVLERSLGAVVRAEEEPGEAVGLDAVALLRHREVAAPQPCLDMCQWNRRVRGRMCSRERRVRVPVDEHEVGFLRADVLRDRRLHRVDARRVEVEAVAGLRQAELVEEHLRHDVVPVLTRVEDDLVHAGGEQRTGEWGGLDELRAVPDDREDLHASEPKQRRGHGQTL